MSIQLFFLYDLNDEFTNIIKPDDTILFLFCHITLHNNNNFDKFLEYIVKNWKTIYYFPIYKDFNNYTPLKLTIDNITNILQKHKNINFVNTLDTIGNTCITQILLDNILMECNIFIYENIICINCFNDDENYGYICDY